jgi:ubiquinone/menaquinone biosynthesis C-methylase UbiE
MASDNRSAIVSVFDAAADEYDSVGVDFFQPIADRLVDELVPEPGERAIDIGCGRGQVLFRLVRAVAPGGRALGLDLAPRMVAAAAEEAVKRDLDVEVRVGNAQAPELPRGTFDIVASSLVLFFLPDPGTALRAWRAGLAPNGRLGVSTFGPHTTEGWSEVDRMFAPFLPVVDPTEGTDEDPFSSDGGVEQLLIDAGFVGVRTEHMIIQPRFDSAEHWYRWTMSHAQRGRWQMVPTDQRSAVLAGASEALDRCRDHDGRIGFDQIVRFTTGHR